MREKKLKLFIALLVFTITTFIVSVTSTYSITPEAIKELAVTRINEIKNNGNTDITKITGNIYYVSASGSDANDGLSKERPIKSLSKVMNMMYAKTFKNGDAILFNDGDTFRGSLSLQVYGLTLGSYGDIKKGKPKIYGPSQNSANSSLWVEVSPNIWKYQQNGKDAVITSDIGAIWFFCNKGNNNCSRTTTDGKTKYSFGDKKIPYKTFEDTDENIFELLANDLDFYHSGHASNAGKTGKNLYLYSVGNPGERFDDIEIAPGNSGIAFGNYTDIVIDNLEVKFYGHHGINGGTVANLTISNCEIAYIGGMKQYYNDDGRPTRLGNGVEIYGEVKSRTGYPVKDGFVLKNNYVYEIYDAGLTFQYTAEAGHASKVEKATFDGNVIENCAYAIEYWNETRETSETKYTNQTYINQMYIKNNILRTSGYGYTETRPRHTEALIKAWDVNTDTKNVVEHNGEYIIENNIFDTTNVDLKPEDTTYVGPVMLHISASNAESLPIIRNNKFYNYNGRLFGYIYSNDTQKILLDYNKQLKYNEGMLKDNEFVIYDDSSSNPTNTVTGTTGNATYTINLSKRTLTISGSGDMADYNAASETPWNQYKDYISKVVIDENVTYIGTYAFTNLFYVQEFHFNAKSLKSLKTNNMSLYMVGKKSTGIKLYIGPKVTKIPYNFSNPSNWLGGSPYFTSITFEGDLVTTIDSYALSYTYIDAINIPESVENINTGAFMSNPRLRVIVFPSKVTKLSEIVLKNCKYLESVVLGANITTAEIGALKDLPNFNKLVIPNESFTLPTDVPVITNVSPVGFQLFGPSSFESIIENMKSTYGAKLYYIPLKNYRPLIQGDGKNYIVLFDELHYGDSGSYEVKTLSNSDNVITGAKYRFVDKFKREFLMDGVSIDITNHTVSDAKMDVKLLGFNTNKDSKAIEAQNVIVLGNSYTKGFGSQGMAATDIEYDYYYYVTQYLKSLNPNIKPVRTTVNRWESAVTPELRKEKTQEIIDEFNGLIDPNLPTKTVFLQLGENVGSFEDRRATFKSDFDYFLKEFIKAYPDAKIYVMYNTKVNVYTIGEMQEVADNNNIEVIQYNKSSARENSFMGAKYYDVNRSTLYVTNDGIAGHPGDYGFVKIASMIVDHLKNSINSEVSPVTSNKYTIDTTTIKVSPVVKTLLRNDFVNNITATDQIKVIKNGTEITTNIAIGTDTTVKVGNAEYKLVLIGDVTGDGYINLSDVSKIYNYYKGKTTLTGNYLKAAKVNNSSSVTLSDVSKLYNYYKGKTKSL